ncbi:hypothetical protein RhiJN_27190 [Ceratobasidium sp. AG-Ba]|nr:hypothetical protein RhiJN_27190 [Ceratobasidium sp. AG-Ba]
MSQQTTFPAPINLSTAGTDDILQWLVAAVTHVNQQAITDTQHFNTELAAAGAAVNSLQTSVNQLLALQVAQEEQAAQEEQVALVALEVQAVNPLQHQPLKLKWPHPTNLMGQNGKTQ